MVEENCLNPELADVELPAKCLDHLAWLPLSRRELWSGHADQGQARTVDI